MDALSASRLKIERAQELIESLRVELQTAMAAEDNKLRGDLRREEFNGLPALTLFVTVIPLFPPDVSLAIGEIVHQLRSSLDNAAWSLVPASTKKTLSKRHAQRVCFPMARSRRSLVDNLKFTLPDVAPPHVAVVERHQPYHRTPLGRTIRTLQALSNTDKHRFIVPAHFYPLSFHMEIKYENAQQVELIKRLNPGQTVIIGRDLATWTFTASPTKVQLDFSLTGTPAFNPSLIRPVPGNSIEDVTGTLKTISGVCADVVKSFAAPPT
jgi:hypothetical protein